MWFLRAIKWIVCCILSLMFPYHGPLGTEEVHGPNLQWEVAKKKESDAHYGGHDGTTWRYEK